MIQFKTIIQKFDQQGEKTGWTYILVPAEQAQKIFPGNKKSFRVKGKLDDHAIRQIALLPMGEGDFILPLNAAMRRNIGKRKGAQVKVQLMRDEAAFQFNKDMMACLEDEPRAMAGFKKLSGAEQKYFSKWIDSAKTDATRAKRIAMMLNAMMKGFRYGEMIRAAKGEE